MNSDSLHFIVFLSRKMVTADVAVPFFVALNATNACKVTFITFDKQTAEQIKENQLLCSAIESIGCLIHMPTQKHNGCRSVVAKVLIAIKLLNFFFEKIVRKKHFFFISSSLTMALFIGLVNVLKKKLYLCNLENQLQIRKLTNTLRKEN